MVSEGVKMDIILIMQKGYWVGPSYPSYSTSTLVLHDSCSSELVLLQC